MEGMPVRYKRATAPLDETARQRLWSTVPLFFAEESAELADLVDSFYEGNGEEREGIGFGSGRKDCGEMLDAVLAESGADPVAERIRVEVEEAVGAVGSGMDEVKRRVMSRLRDKGFDAGLCKSGWDRTGSFLAGYHEYIDVIDSNGTRYIVEINLAGEFEIARPTDGYLALLGALPTVFVGRPEVLMGVINVMCAAAKESIESAGMHVPPWRRREYVQEKWFSSYKRTTTKKIPTVGGVAGSVCLSSQKFCRMELAAGREWKRDGEVAIAFRGM